MRQPLKYRIGSAFFEPLTGNLGEAIQTFDSARFRMAVLDQEWEGRELKARIHASTNPAWV